MRAAVTGAAAAGIGGVVEAVERSGRAVIVRILGAQQILLVEAVVDLQIPLIVVTLHRLRIDPVDSRTGAGTAEVGFRKVLHEGFGYRVDQVSLPARQSVRGSVGIVGKDLIGRMLRVDGAGVSRQVILWDGYEAPSAANRRVIVARIGIPELTARVGAYSPVIEGSTGVPAELAEVALALIIAGHTIEGRPGQLGDASALVVKEEEHLILPDRSADGATEVVAPQGYLGNSLVVTKPVICVHLVVTQKLEQAAVKAVGARACDHIDDGGAAEPVFGAEVRFLHLELFNGID